MKEILIQKHKDKYKELERISQADTEIYINVPLSKRIVLEILKRSHKIERIYAPESAVKHTSNKIIKALEKAGVQYVVLNKKRGRPKKYPEEKIKLLRNEFKAGKSPIKLSKLHNIPLRTVYKLVKNK